MPKKTVFLTIVLASLLVMGVAPARADHPDRSGPRHGIDANRLEVLSHRLERGVQQLQREARQAVDDHRRRGHRPLPALHQLEKRTSRFNDLVERRPRATRQLIAHFRDVGESFRVAEARAERLRSRHLRREFRRVGALLEEIDHELHRRARLAQHRGPTRLGDFRRRPPFLDIALRW